MYRHLSDPTDTHIDPGLCLLASFMVNLGALFSPQGEV